METNTFSIEELFDFLAAKQRVISIIGMEKNIGKTTLLNFLLKGMYERSLPTLVMSVGRDGEAIDSVENTPKPEIIVYKGGCFLTINELITTPSSVEILETFDVKVSGSKVILARALADTKIQLVNPANQMMLSKLIDQGVRHCGKCTVLIDGALDRFSHGSTSLIDGVFVCAGVQTAGDLPLIIKKTKLLIGYLECTESEDYIRRLIRNNEIEKGSAIIRDRKAVACITGTLLDTTELDEKIKNNDIIYTTGVITDKIMKRFIDRELNVTIVLIDGTRCHISQRYSLIINRKRIAIRVLNRIPVYGLAVNSVGIRRSMNPSKVLKDFREAFKDLRVFDTRYLM